MDSYSERTTRIRRILIGVDFSEESLAAARWIAHQFADTAELVLLHVVPLPPVPSFCRDILPDQGAMAAQVMPRLEGGLRGFAATLGTSRVTAQLRAGIPFEQLADVAAEEHADLIALGRTGQRAGTWRRLGSTADRLIRRARVPVLIVPANTAPVANRILAAVDDAPIASPVLEHASLLAKHFAARVSAIHVLSSAIGAGRGVGLAKGARVPTAGIASALRGATHAWLRERLDAGGAGAAMSDIAVAIGDAGSEILLEAQRTDAELIVLGRWGADTGGQAGTGAVTRFVLRGSRCPVLVITDGGTGPAPLHHRRLHHALPFPRRASRLTWIPKGDGDPAA